jgi:hypothetical protein
MCHKSPQACFERESRKVTCGQFQLNLRSHLADTAYMTSKSTRASRTLRRRRVARVSPYRSRVGQERGADGAIIDREYDWEVRPWRAGGGFRLQLKWKCSDEPVIALVALQNLQCELLPVLERQLVDELRGVGFSWADIGGLLGITGEATRQHFAGE